MSARHLVVTLLGVAPATVLAGCKGQDDDLHFVPPATGVVSSVESVPPPTKVEPGPNTGR
jgi:uncharacterized lipoprotein YajG